MSKKLTSQKAPDYKGEPTKFTGNKRRAFGTWMIETEVTEGRNAGARQWRRADKLGVVIDEPAEGEAAPTEKAKRGAEQRQAIARQRRILERALLLSDADKPAKMRGAKKPKSPTPSEVIAASALGPKLCYGLKLGQQLRKTFKGREIVVDITENGYEYDGKRFRTITSVAHHITGYGISGPVFFGLATVTKKSA